MTNPILEIQTLNNTYIGLPTSDTNSASCTSKLSEMDIHGHLPPPLVSGIKRKREGSPPPLSAKVESNTSNGPDRKIKKIRTETGIGPSSIEHKHPLSSCIDAPAVNPQVFVAKLRSVIFTALTELSKQIVLANDRSKACCILATMRSDPQYFDEWLQKAIINARWITDPNNQATALLEIALRQAQRDPEKAGKLFSMALQASFKIPLTSPSEKMNYGFLIYRIIKHQAEVDPRKAMHILKQFSVVQITCYTVVKALAKIDQEEAMRLSDYCAEQTSDHPRSQEIKRRCGIDDSLQEKKEEYYQYVIQGLTEVKAEEAIKLIFQLLTKDWNRAQCIAAIIQSDPATNLEQIFEWLSRLEDQEAKDSALVKIVEALAKIDPAQAIMAAEQIKTPSNKISAYTYLIKAIVKSDIEKAFNLFEELKKERLLLEKQTTYSLQQENTAHYHILVELVKSDPMKVLKISEAITSNEAPYFFRDQARSLAACELAKTDLPLAISIAQSLQNEEAYFQYTFESNLGNDLNTDRTRDRAYCAIAEVEAVTNLEQALKKVDLIEEQMTRDKAYAAIAQAVALPHPLQAHNIVNLIQRPETQNQAYTAIALAQTDPEKALEVINLTQDVSLQATLLAAVGKKYIPLDTNLASQFFTRALAAAESTKPNKDLCPYSTFELVCNIFGSTFTPK